MEVSVKVEVESNKEAHVEEGIEVESERTSESGSTHESKWE